MTIQGTLVFVLLFGVTTIWVREPWAVHALEITVFLFTSFVLLADAVRRRDWRPSLIAVIPVAICAWGCAQFFSHTTAVPSATHASALYWLAGACLVFLGQRACASPDLRDRFLTLALAAGTTVCLLGTVQLFTSDGLVFWLFPSGYDSQVIGPFPYRNNYAAFAELLLPIALALGLRAKQWHVWIIVAASLYASVLASGSRAGSALATLEVATVFLLARSRIREAIGAAKAVSIFVSLAAIFTLVVGYQFIWQRFSESDPLALRREFLQSSIEMVRAQPLRGFGLGTWTSVYPQFAIVDPGLFANHAHNEWAQWAAEGGLPVFAFLLALFIWTIRPAIQSIWGIGVLSVFVHSLVDYPFVRLGLAAWIFVLIGALAAWKHDHAAPRPTRRLSWPPALAAALVLLVATFYTARTAWADILFRQATPESVRQAVRLQPDRAEYHAALAQIDNDHAVQHLERAVTANPYRTSARISLAGQMEARQDYARAAELLLEAARRDHLYTPAWALANFYFRRDDPDNFWTWARRAAAISYGDLAPLFDLCFAIRDDPDAVRDHLAVSPRITRQLFAYIMTRRQTDDLSAQAHSLAETASIDDRLVLLDYTDRALGAGQIDTAADVWTLLSAKGLVAGPKDSKSLLSNGDFREDIINRGFDWRTHPVDGIAPERQVRDGSPLLAVSLSGRQPENCDVISQFLHLQPGTSYTFAFEYRTESLPADTGLAWSFAGLPPLGLKASTEWTTGRADVRGTRQLDRLLLKYSRVPGTTRAEGALFLRNVSLAPVALTLRSAND
jgi:O-antigen ligase